MEKILNIEQIENHKIEDKDYPGYSDTYDGFKVTTDKQEIFVLISNNQSCCESWGYLSTVENPKDYVGADLLKIEVVDKDLNKEPVYYYDGGAMFVNFETSKGLFQLTVYNSHNGYYGHAAKLISNQLNKEEGL